MGLFKKKKPAQQRPPPQQEKAEDPPWMKVPIDLRPEDIPVEGSVEPELSGRALYYACKPDGWPDARIVGNWYHLQVMSVGHHLGEAKLGEVGLHIKGASEEQLRNSVPIHVQLPTGQMIPVLVVDRPFPDDEGDLTRPMLKPILATRMIEPFRYGPVVVYSRFPIPDIVRHFCEPSQPVLFECSIFDRFLDHGQDLEAMSEAFVDLAKEFYGHEMDYSMGSLQQVDEILYTLHWTDETPPLYPTVLSIGAYVGYTIRTRVGGEWEWGEGEPYPTLNLGEFPERDLRGVICEPVWKVHKQIADKAGDEVKFFAEQTVFTVEGKRP